MIEEIKSILMKRDGLSDSEAESKIEHARELFDSYLMSEDTDSLMTLCEREFGLGDEYLIAFL